MKTLKITIVLMSILLALPVVKAQQVPDFTLYNQNMMLLNPSYAGITDGISLNTGFRKQWLGIQGAPQTLSFSGHGYIEKFRVGAGLTGWQYKAGALNQTTIYTNYSYRLDLGFARLNLGLQAGIVNYRSDYTAADLNGVDDPIFMDDVNQTNFNWGGGAFLYGDKFYAGLSVPVLSSYEGSENTLIKMDQHYYLTGGYLFDLSEKFVLKPHALMRAVSDNPLTWNLGATVYYGENFGLGALYKSQKTLAFHIDLIFERTVYVSYAYDLPGSSDISAAENGSHAFTVHYLIPGQGKSSEQPIRYY